jgi:hypothetical protein
LIKGEKVGLRAIEKEDLILLRDWRNIVEFRKNFREVRELSLADQESWFTSLQDSKHINYMFMIVDLKTDKPIGAAGLLYINLIIRSADFSFYIGDQNKYIGDDGIANESAQLLINYDSQKINFFKNNFSFKQDGLLRDNCFEEGKYWNSLILSLLKND